MKNTRLMRLLIAMIAALMVLGCVLTSCTKTPDDPEKDTSDTNDTGEGPSNTGDTGDTEEDPFEALQGTTFDGAPFIVYSYNHSQWITYLDENDSGTENLNKAAVDRNGMVEELLDVKFDFQYSTSSHDKVLSDYMNLSLGGHCADLIVPWATEKMTSVIVGGYLYDVASLDYMNLEADYYNQSANKNFTIKGQQYAFVSDYTYPVQQRFALLTNLEIIDDTGALENLDTDAEDYYELVMNGELTVENMLLMTEGLYNNNGKEDALEGTYGFVTNPNSAGRMFQDWGVELVSTDADGELVFNLYNADIEAKYSKLQEIVHDGDTYYDLGGANAYYGIFKAGRAMFSTFSSDPYGFVNDPWKSMRFAYGPMPKYEAEDDYVTVSHGGLIMVPSLIEDEDMVGATIEALSIASQLTIKEEYINHYFETRVIQEPEGIELYELLRDTAYIDMNRYFDPHGQIAGVGFITTPLKDKKSLSDQYDEFHEAIETAYESLWNRFG